jgi:hypothetical protein
MHRLLEEVRNVQLPSALLALTRILCGVTTLVSAAVIGPSAVGLVSTASAGPGRCYIASSGDCVHDPERSLTIPPGATARCEDGEYSFSEHPYSGGTCHGHGGVAQVLAP